MESKKIPIKFHCSCQIENRIYFFNMTFNGVFYIDIDDMSTHFVHSFSSELLDAVRLSNIEILYDEGSLYFFPHRANAIMKYDIMKQEEQVIHIESFGNKFAKIKITIRRQNIVYMFPSDLGEGIYVFDLQKQKVKKDNELSALFGLGSYCANVFLLHDESVLISMHGNNRLVEVNLITKEIVISKVLKKDIHIFSMIYDGKDYWILQTDSTDIYRWNRETDIFQVYVNKNIVWEDRASVPYSNLIFFENEILVLNCGLKNILRIDENNKTITKPIEFPKEFRLVNNIIRGWAICDGYTILTDKVLLHPCRGNMLLVYNKRTQQISGKEMSVSAEEICCAKERIKVIFEEKKICMESIAFSTLDNFIEMIEPDNDYLLSNKNIGRLIYCDIR